MLRKLLAQQEQLLQGQKTQVLALPCGPELLPLGAATAGAAATAAALQAGTGKEEQQQQQQLPLLPIAGRLLAGHAQQEVCAAAAAAVPSAAEGQGGSALRHSAEGMQQGFQLPVVDAAEGAAAGLGTVLVPPIGHPHTHDEEVAAVAALCGSSCGTAADATQPGGTAGADAGMPPVGSSEAAGSSTRAAAPAAAAAAAAAAPGAAVVLGGAAAAGAERRQTPAHPQQQQ